MRLMAFAYERRAMRGNLVLALIGIAAALYVVSLFRPQYEETKLKGPARVIDGDTNEIAGPSHPDIRHRCARRGPDLRARRRRDLVLRRRGHPLAEPDGALPNRRVPRARNRHLWSLCCALFGRR